MPQASGLAVWASSLTGWASDLASWASDLDGWPRGRTNKQTDEQRDGRKISPFYRTLSPIGAAALLPEGESRPIKRSRAREFDDFGQLVIMLLSASTTGAPKKRFFFAKR